MTKIQDAAEALWKAERQLAQGHQAVALLTKHVYAVASGRLGPHERVQILDALRDAQDNATAAMASLYALHSIAADVLKGAGVELPVPPSATSDDDDGGESGGGNKTLP
jgi:hypothetical protein